MRSFEEVYRELVEVQVRLLKSYSEMMKSVVDVDESKFAVSTPAATEAVIDLKRVLSEVLEDHKDEIFANRDRLSKALSVIGIIGQINNDAIKILDEFKL